MQEQLAFLVELQRIDSVIFEMKNKSEELPKRISDLDAEINALKEELEGEKASLEEQRSDRRTKEGFLKSEQERILKSEGRLKDIKTQKEYQALSKEIEQGKKLNASREDDLLRMMTEIEEKEAGIKAKEEKLGAKKEEYRREKKLVDCELSKIANEFDGKKREAEDISKKVKPNILRLYQRVFERRNISSVVPMRDSSCGGCHMSLSPHFAIQIQKGVEMHQCPSCHRILYWEANP